jgi:hypothetical protein
MMMITHSSYVYQVTYVATNLQKLGLSLDLL